uniref:MCE family protein n=1 Tax=candidate division WOR-3 bacterium TaxID=2052148 RepID=A0A7C3UQC6_UNCW3
MEKRSIFVKIGFLTVVVLLIFFVGQLWLQEFRVRRSGYVVNVFFNDVSGLKENDPVRVYGIKKGNVKSMTIMPDGVVVKLWIERDVVLKKDVLVSIQDVAMISGTKTIVIEPGKSEEIWNIKDTIQGKPNLGLATLEVGTLASQFTTLVEILKSTLNKGIGSLGTAEVILMEMNRILKENQNNIRLLLSNSSQDAESLKTTLSILNKDLNELNNILTKINKKEGTLGKLIYDDEIYKNINEMIKEISNTARDIRENPKRYINIKVF